MISQYSRPEDIDREFWQDYPKAIYWLGEHVNRSKEKNKIFDDSWGVLNFSRSYSFSEPVFYESPKTGNKWMLWITTTRRSDGIHYFSRAALYHLTSVSMTMMIPMVIAKEDEDGNSEYQIKGVNVYTDHMFRRISEKDRLGVEMDDRFSVMRNFSEFVAEGWSDTRPPRDGEKHTQILFRTPASWIRGHTVTVGSRAVNIYRTFWADKSMTPSQLKDVRSFAKFADTKMSEKQKKDGDGIAWQ